MHADIRRTIYNSEYMVYGFNISVTHGSENSKINSKRLEFKSGKKMKRRRRPYIT